MRKIITLLYLFFLSSTVQIIAQVSNVLINLNNPNSIAISGNELFFSSWDGTISKFNLSENNPEIEVIVSNLPLYSLGSIALNGNYLYYSLVIPGQIFRININENSPTHELVAENVRYADNIVFSNNLLFFTNSGANYSNYQKISKIDINDPTFPVINLTTSEYFNNFGLAIKDDYLYFSAVTKISRFNIYDSSPTVSTFKSLTGHSSSIAFYENDLYSDIRESEKIIKIDISSATPAETPIIHEVVENVRSLAFHNHILYIAYGDKIGMVDTTLSINNNIFPSKKYMLYPNPVINKINISNLRSQADYEIFDVLGKLIEKGKSSENGNIDVEHLNYGIYLLKMNKKNILKFIKK